MKKLFIIALTWATLSHAYGQTDSSWHKGPAYATVDIDALDTRQHTRFPCSAEYERIRTHKTGDSPAMWHDTYKEGTIKRTRDAIFVAGQKYEITKSILSGKLELTFDDADWTRLIVHTPKLDYIYIIESENCPYAGIED